VPALTADVACSGGVASGNTEAVADAVPVLGGCVIEPPNDVPGVGRTAACPTILSASSCTWCSRSLPRDLDTGAQ